MVRYVGYQKVREQFDISAQTVKNWAKNGKIGFRAIQNDTRKTWLYDLESIGNYIQETTTASAYKVKRETTVLYCRVSSKKQEPDLQRQIELLSGAFPEAELIKDIGSGLNFKREGFTKMVERVCRGDITRIVVTYKDRLMRFGYDLFKQICKENNCEIMVYSKEHELLDVASEEETRELQEDLLSIINVFVARRNGKRASQLKKERKRIKEGTKLTHENQVISNTESEEEIK